MPTYEYRCKSCGHELEAVQSFTDDSLTECPACGGLLRKVFGSIGITFKGSGFYKTDSRSGSKTSSSTKSDSGDGATGTKESSSGDGAKDTSKKDAKASESSSSSSGSSGSTSGSTSAA